MALIPGIIVEPKICPHISQGLFPRLVNLAYTFLNRAEINHITGDVHYLALGLNPKKTLLTIHDCETVRRRKGYSRFFIYWLWYKLPCLWVRRITTISEFTRDDLINLTRCDPKKIRVVYDIISDAYQPCPKPFNVKCPTVLQVGAAHNKNIPRLAEALHGLSCKLRVIGKLKPEQIEVLDAYKIDYSYVYNLDESALVKEYEGCDMLAFVSTYEGFGMPILEAQSVGRPVVTSNVCSMPEVGADAVCYVDPYNVNSIREGILKIINDERCRKQLVEKGFVNVKRFSPQAIAEEYFNIYKELL